MGPSIDWGIMKGAIRPVGYIAGWDSWMEWTLRLVGTGADGQFRSFDVMLISRPEGLGEIANLGLTLTEAGCFGRTVSHAARGTTRRVGGRLGLRRCSARSG
jgi:hypothetical protein